MSSNDTETSDFLDCIKQENMMAYEESSDYEANNYSDQANNIHNNNNDKYIYMMTNPRQSESVSMKRKAKTKTKNNNNSKRKVRNINNNNNTNNKNTNNNTNNTVNRNTNANKNDICLDMRRKTVCMRNILNALQTINSKCETVIGLCSCPTNIGQTYKTDLNFVQLLNKYNHLRDKLIVAQQYSEKFGSSAVNDQNSEQFYSGVKNSDNNKSKPKSGTKVTKQTVRKSVSSSSGGNASNNNNKVIKKHKCWYEGCNGAFRSHSNLMAHIAKHTGEKAFVCEWPGCGKEFPYKRSLDRHVEALHLRSARFCCEWPACDQSFITKNQLDCHMTNTHTGQKLYKCNEPDCQFETNYLKHMKDHKMRHDPNYIPEKPKTRQIVIRADGALDEAYINKKTGRPLRRKRRPMNHRCSWPKCEFTFDSPNALAKHMRVHTGERPYKCEWPGCDRVFRYSHTVRVHVEMIHLMLKKYKCSWPACDSAFVSQIQLDVHHSDVHVGVKKFKCDWPGCDWIGTNHARELRFHKLRRHENVKIVRKSHTHKEKAKERRDKKHVCNWPECGKHFLYKSALVKHMRSHRPLGEKLIVCDYEGCHKKFGTEENLARHKIVHDPNKKYICDWPECSAAYHSKMLLESHIHAKHTGERPFVCDWPACGATFTYKSNWRMHYKNVHEMTEKPFHCDWDQCEKSFVKKKTLVEHIAKKHLHKKNTDLQYI